MQSLADETSFVSGKWLGEMPEQSMPEERWPRRWRYVFVFGSALLIWIALWLVLRAL